MLAYGCARVRSPILTYVAGTLPTEESPHPHVPVFNARQHCEVLVGAVDF